MAMDSGGRLVVGSFGAGGIKLSFFEPGGKFLEDWTVMSSLAPGQNSVSAMPGQLWITDVGIFTGVRRLSLDAAFQTWKMPVGLQRVGREGLQGEPWFAPPLESKPPVWKMSIQGRTIEIAAPMSAATPVVTVTPDGHRVWGHPDAYRFHIAGDDGTETVVERVVDPVLVDPDQARYERDMMEVLNRRQLGDAVEFSGDLSSERAYYLSLRVDDSGRVWVACLGPAEHVEECTSIAEMTNVDQPVPCWKDRSITDVFNLDGEYLGMLAQSDLRFGFGGSFIRGDTLITGYQDDMGTAKVRVYRLITPA